LEFSAVAATASEPTTLSGTIQWDVAALGLNYVTLSLSLASPAANFATRTNALVYFQIEKPVFPAATRLLQAAANTTNSTNTTNTTVPSGTGDFEGHALVFNGADAAVVNTTNTTKIAFNYNSYSRNNCADTKVAQ
jgi:hypothetical protein